VVVRAGADTDARLTLAPTAETYVAYTRGARRQRAWGWAATAGGLVLAAASGVLAWHYAGAARDAQKTADAFEAMRFQYGASCDAILGGGAMDYCQGISDGNFDRLNAARDRRNLSFIGVAVGGAAAALGAYLLLSADDPRRYDQPSAALAPWVDPAGGGLALAGRF
jgi:hypothetical protein